MVNNVGKLVVDSSSVYPFSNNAISLGRATNVWTNIYAQNGTIITSDERTKANVYPSDLGIEFIQQLKPVRFNYIESDSTSETAGVRTHYGLIAQQVKQSLDAVGCADFGGYVLADKTDPSSKNMLRYDEFSAPIIKSIQELSAMVSTQQSEIVSLRSTLSSKN
jgi:hypothetical protein